ncbi:DUF1801 domain-containing protein [Lewinella sp. JB7]|uniref:DUF1801 domain-containing protein n=1 Tax=Lewinella sp. JB7 TaxID=2962887 RepID=UPI0020C9B7BF|nr:DUF1801 domain-containing protein [Lewinella sp. JB7]MCP9237338.1 DUF1801 domain-containing protein [Lewinella sp. JB7]
MQHEQSRTRKLTVRSSPAVAVVFDDYPDSVRRRMRSLWELVIETARKVKGLNMLEETLKWGEPSYLTRRGSTLRMDWKAQTPRHYALYFRFTSRLVVTFRAVFGDTLSFGGNRSSIFRLEESLPKEELRHCIRAALTYQEIKKLPILGMPNQLP